MVLKKKRGVGEPSLLFFFFFEDYVECRGKARRKEHKQREYIINVPFTRLSGGPIGIHYITGINNIHEWISNEIVA